MKKIIFPALLIFLPTVGLVAYYFLTVQSRDVNVPSVLLSKVGRHYVLPEKSEPAIATVTDKTKVTTEFLKPAKDGDKIIIYQEEKLVLVYRPSIDRLIAVGPVSISSPANE